MPEYYVNKGVGKTAEFKGLRAQYLYIFAIGLLGSFILFVILYTTGVPVLIDIFLVVVLATGLLYGVFSMNKKYGEHGLMKLGALKKEPQLLKNDGTISLKILHGKKTKNKK